MALVWRLNCVINNLNQYTQRTVAGALDVFGRVQPGVDVRINGAEADLWEGSSLAGPWNYFHHVVSVDNFTAAQYPEITIQAGNAFQTRHVFVPNPSPTMPTAT